jgi:RNA recognition motif-containing protein
MLFSTYGPVLDVVAMKTQKMRGQAHIAFRDTQAATQAMRSLEGFSFLGQELVRSPTSWLRKNKANTLSVEDIVCQVQVGCDRQARWNI